MTQAAGRVFVSQQALSNHISKLESELSTRLFERSPRLSLTLAGKCLQKSAAQIMDIYDQLLHEINDINNQRRGELRIGVSYTRSQTLLPQLLPAFHETHPLVDISLFESSASTMEDRLAYGMVDLLLARTPIQLDCAAVIELGRERMLLVVPRSIMERRHGDRLSEMCRRFAAGVEIGEFCDEPFILTDGTGRIRRLVDKQFSQCGAKPNIFLETRNLQTAYALSQKGMGLTILPEYYLGNGMRQGPCGTDNRQSYYFPLTGEGAEDMLVVAYNRERYLSKPALDFIELAKEKLSR